MASAQRGAVLHHLGRLFGLGTVAGLSEWQLLSRYLNDRDEAAFEALVARHGPMVLGVCRRLLADPNDVDDAFQATFLVLVRKASSLGERDAIGHWLYGVAYRVALRARSEAAQRRRREPSLAADPRAPETDPIDFGLGPVLDEELNRLPAKYRAPIVLCHLEGLTHEEAATQLQWPLGTVKGRLVRARDLLKRRLVRRGLGLSAALSAASLSRDAVAVVPESLRSATVVSAMKLAAGPITAGMVSASVAVLLEGVLSTMLWTKLKAATAATLIFGLLSAGAVGIAQQSSPEPQADAVSVGSSTPERPNEVGGHADPDSRTSTAAQGGNDEPEPTPYYNPAAGEKAQRQLATEIFREEMRALRRDGPSGPKLDELARWSKQIVDDSISSSPDRIKALTEHSSRMRSLWEATMMGSQNRGDNLDTRQLLHRQAAYYLQAANQMLAQAQKGHNDQSPGSSPGLNGSDADPRSKAILEKLDTSISMSFGNETPLEDVLKYVQSATAGPGGGKGIPIYVDPLGLQEAEKTMTSPVTLDLDGIPLRTTLELLLQQLGLIYKIKGGLLIITKDSEDETPIAQLKEKVIRGEATSEEIAKLLDMLNTINEIKKLEAEGRKLEQEVKKGNQ